MAKKRDRDEESGSVGISVRLPAALLTEIDKIADAERRTRGNVMRILLEDAIETRNIVRQYSGQGKLIFQKGQAASVNYQINEFQPLTPGGSPIRRGRVTHTEGHPLWHPITSLHPGPFVLAMSDGRKLKVFLKSLQGWIEGTGDFF
jgi:hypothetical protein